VLRLVALPLHEFSAECALGFELVVGPAPQPEVLHGRLASARDRPRARPGRSEQGVSIPRGILLAAGQHRRRGDGDEAFRQGFGTAAPYLRPYPPAS